MHVLRAGSSVAAMAEPRGPVPTTKLTPDELLTHLREALAVLGRGELRGALDETLGEPGRAERRIRESRLPVRKTFEAFNFAFQPKLDKDLVMELATLRFVAQGKERTPRQHVRNRQEPARARLDRMQCQ